MIINELARTIAALGGEMYYAGGVVRDMLLAKTPNDIDIVVRNLSFDSIIDICQNAGLKPDIGNEQNYPFVQFCTNNMNYEITIPRVGGSSMESQPDPCGTLQADSARRDFTVNALYQNVLTHNIHDYVGGIEDLHNKILRPVSPYFVEDPRRIVRGWAMVARFGLYPANILFTYAHQLRSDVIPNEVWGTQFKKLCAGQYVYNAMQYLRNIGWINRFLFWSAQIDFDQQHPKHQESLWEHTLMVANLATYYGPKFVAAALFHDCGKLHTQDYNDSGIATYHKHADVSADIVFDALSSFAVGSEFLMPVYEIVKFHMHHYHGTEDKQLRKLQSQLKFNTLLDLARFTMCDMAGRIPAQGALHIIDAVQDFESRESNKFVPILRGRDVVALGIEPGPRVGEILREAESAQVNGEFNNYDSAIIWLRKQSW